MEQLDDAANPRGLAEFIGSEDLPSLSAGTAIATSEGAIPASWLRAGDLVVTRDRGLQPVLAVGLVELSREYLLDNPGNWPDRVEPGALGPGLPSARLVVSPWQRLLLRGSELQLHFGLTEALVAARHLIGWPGIECDMPEAGMADYQILFERHEIILADGCWTESLFLDSAGLAALRSDGSPVFARLGAGHGRLARPELQEWEAALLTPPAARASSNAGELRLTA